MRKNLNLWGGLLVAALMAVSSAAHGGVTTVGLFTGGGPGDGLDLQGDFVYALDFGRTPGGGTISYAPNVQFQPVTDAHACVVGGTSYGNMPNFGSSADDNLLEAIMYQCIYGWYTYPQVTGSAATALTDLIPGRDYKLQLLFHETYWWINGYGSPNYRITDIWVEGTKIVDKYDIGAATGPNYGGVVTYEFTATDSVLDVMLDGWDWPGYRDNNDNSLFNALTLEQFIPEPAGLGLIGFALLAARKRQR